MKTSETEKPYFCFILPKPVLKQSSIGTDIEIHLFQLLLTKKSLSVVLIQRSACFHLPGSQTKGMLTQQKQKQRILCGGSWPWTPNQSSWLCPPKAEITGVSHPAQSDFRKSCYVHRVYSLSGPSLSVSPSKGHLSWGNSSTHQDMSSSEEVAERVVEQVDEGGCVEVSIAHHLAGKERLPGATTEEASHHPIAHVHVMSYFLKTNKSNSQFSQLLVTSYIQVPI